MADWNDPYRPLPSLADAKSLTISQKLGEKKQRLDPNIPSDEEVRAARERLMGGSTGLGDVAEASLYRTGGNLADVLRTGSNKVFGTEFEDTGREQGWSNPEIADQMAGVSQEYRAQAQAEDQAAMASLAAGDYWDATKNVVSNAPRHLAEQAGVLTELAAGAVATGGVGTAARLAGLAKKGKDAYDAAQKANTITKYAKKAAKIQGQTSLLNADILQGIREDYKAENNGEEPSTERMVGAAAMVMATTSFQPAIIKNLWLPKLGKKLEGNTLRQKFDNQVKALVKYADKGTLENMARTAGAGALKVGKAAGAEGVQEYFQTWAEILSVKMDPEEAGGLLRAGFDEVASEENRNDATYGALVGAVVGGAARGATAVPVAAAGITTDAAVGVAKAAGRQMSKADAVLKFGQLSDQEKADLLDEYENEKTAHEEYKAQSIHKRGVLDKATSFDQVIEDDLRAEMISEAEGKDLNDPTVFETVRKGIIRKAKAQEDVSAAKVKAHYVAKVGEARFKRAWEQTKETVEKYVDIEQIKAYAETVADKAVELGDKAVEEIKNFDQSETLGLAEVAVDWSGDMTKAGWQKVAAKAKQATPEGIRQVAKLFPDGSEAQRRLNMTAQRREAAVKTAGIKKEKLKTWETLDQNIKNIAQDGITTESPNAVARIIREEMKSRPDDKQSVEALTKALDAYEKTSHYKDGIKGSLNADQLRRYRKRLESYKEAYATPARDAIEGIMTNLTNQAVEVATKTVDWAKGKFKEVDVKGYKVKQSEAGTAFLKTMSGAGQKMGAMDADAQLEMSKGLVAHLTSDKMVENYDKMFDTKDPLVIAELIGASMPGFDTKTLAVELTKKMGKPEKATEKVDLKKEKVQKEPLSGKILLTEDNEYIVEQTIKDAEYDEVTDAFAGITICKGS